MSELQAREIITTNMANRLQKMDDEKNTHLLNFMLKQSKYRLESFLDVLRRFNQAHVAKLFELPGKIKMLFFTLPQSQTAPRT